MNATITVRAGIKKFSPVLDGLIKSRFPERRINLNRLAHVKNAHANGRLRIIKTDGQKFVVTIEDNRELPCPALAVLFFNGVGKDPGMAAAHNRFSSRP